MFQSALMGLLSGSAIILGALLGLYLKVNNRVVAAVMAFGAGVLISALSIDLMGEAFDTSRSPLVVGASFLAGALVFVGGDYVIDSNGGAMRRHSHAQIEMARQSDKAAHTGTAVQADPPKDDSGLAILLGTLLDGIPESFVVGASIAAGGSTGWVFVAAVFLSNLPEGISGTMGMKMAGMSALRIMTLWTVTLIVTVLSAVAGYAFLADAPVEVNAATMAFASGAILAMLSDTMIPEAFRFGGRGVALVTVAGFLLAFLLSKMF